MIAYTFVHVRDRNDTHIQPHLHIAHTHVTDTHTTHTQEERGAYFGRVFAFLALIQSGRLTETVRQLTPGSLCSYIIDHRDLSPFVVDSPLNVVMAKFESNDVQVPFQHHAVPVPFQHHTSCPSSIPTSYILSTFHSNIIHPVHVPFQHHTSCPDSIPV